MALSVLPLAITMMAGPQIMSALIFVTGRAVATSVGFVMGVAVAPTVGVTITTWLARRVSPPTTGCSADRSIGITIELVLVALLIRGHGLDGLGEDVGDQQVGNELAAAPVDAGEPPLSGDEARFHSCCASPPSG